MNLVKKVTVAQSGGSTKKKRSTTRSKIHFQHPTQFQSYNTPRPAPISTARRPAGHAAWTSVKRFGRRFTNSGLPQWSLALADQPTFDVKGKHLTIRQVCELVKDITEELPYLVAGEVVKAMHGDHRLIQSFASSRTYATGSQCLLRLLEDRIARQRDN